MKIQIQIVALVLTIVIWTIAILLIYSLPEKRLITEIDQYFYRDGKMYHLTGIVDHSKDMIVKPNSLVSSNSWFLNSDGEIWTNGIVMTQPSAGDLPHGYMKMPEDLKTPTGETMGSEILFNPDEEDWMLLDGEFDFNN